MITIEANGTEYTRTISVEVELSVTTLVRSFVIVVARPNNEPLPFKGGEEIKIKDGSTVICDGFIDVVSPSYSKTEHTVTLQGRSRAQDLVDSALTPLTINADISLTKCIQLAIDQIGINLSVTNNVTGLEDFNAAEDRIGNEVGENAFLFIDKLARKRQVLLTSDAVGNISIERSGSLMLSESIINTIGGSGNVISGEATYNTSKRYNKYIVMSQLNTTTPDYSSSEDSTVDQQGLSVDTQFTRPRQFVIQSEKASSGDQCQKRADWQNNIARANSRIYLATIKGVVTSINALQFINDEFAGINEIMLIKSITITQSKDAGTLSTISFVDKNAFDQQLAKPQKVSNEFVG